MYARRVGDQELTLGVSGMLWEGSLIMVDEQTESLWSQMLGEAMRGPLEGQTLQQIPAVITDWKAWRTQRPNTTVLVMSRTANRFRSDRILAESGLAICLDINDKAKAWPIPFATPGKSRTLGVANDRLAGAPIVVLFDATHGAAVIFNRMCQEQELQFEVSEDSVVDLQTQSVWDPTTGVAQSGPLKGKQLTMLPAMVSELSVWSLYHPDGLIWGP